MLNSDLMIQSASLSRSPLQTDLPPRERAGDARFARSLAAFLVAGDEDAPDPKVPADKRKDAAAPGKPLPDEERRDDAALAWLMTMTPVQVVPPPVTGVAGRPAATLGADVSKSLSPPPFALSEVEGPVREGASTSLSTNGRGGNTAGLLDDVVGNTVHAPAIENGTVKAAVNPGFQPDAKRIEMTAVPTSVSVCAPVATPPAPVTAAQVFGAAMREAERNDAKRADSDIAPLAPASVPVEAQRHAVAATGETQQAPLDMGHDRWPHRMIERIESMRDAADAVDTRIRLVPDALGAIDVSMRRDGDAVHVHFAAEQAATRALLTDAQPRLAELAQARGIRLGGSAVDSGGADARQDRAPAPTPLPQTPARVVAEPTTPDDARIA